MENAQNDRDSPVWGDPEPQNDAWDNEAPVEPEPEDKGMVVKPQCDCATCQYWITSADWCPPDHQKFDCMKEKAAKQRLNLHLLRPDGEPQKPRQVRWYNPKHLTKVERQTISKVLVHGEVIPEPVATFPEAYFSKDVQLSLERLKYRYSMQMQSFAWPAIFRQLNVLLIGGPKSGKTLSYLPAVCTFCTSDNDKYRQMSKYKGPLVVVVCPNSSQCEEVYDLIKKLYENIKQRPRVFIVTYPVTYIPPCDIMITIPETLIYCLKSRSLNFNFKRLCHLVLEDASTLLGHHGESMNQILKVADEVVEHRLPSSNIQLIVTSQKWSSDLKQLIKSLYVPPLVCIGNHIEAALYGGIHFDTKFLKADQKMAHLEGVLKREYPLPKTIIVCNQVEILELEQFLVGKGFKATALSGEMSKEEVDQHEIEWSFAQGHEKVLLCTDFVLDSQLCISDATWLIHYSFPETWTAFTRRFSALSSHYRSPLESDEEPVRCKSLIIIDETCEKQTLKILTLLGRLTKELPPTIQNYAKEFQHRAECDKLEAGVDLCDTLKLHGKCGQHSCEKRHFVSADDVADHLPKSGRVVFKILDLKDVTHCTVQLLQHIDLEGRTSDISDDDLRKPLVNVSNIPVADVELGKFYAHCDYTQAGAEYSLCHVLKVENQTVEVKLVSGLTLQTLRSKLFPLPDTLKIVDVYFCNLVPPFKDQSFSGRSFFAARTALEKVDYKKMNLTGTIFLQMNNTLWLDDVVQRFHVGNVDVVKFNLTKHLITMGVVEPSRSQIGGLHKLCAKCEVTVPTHVRVVAKRDIPDEVVEPRMAFLNENTTEVILSSAVSPEEFYVRIAKFQSLLLNLEKDIQTSIRTDVLNITKDIEIGRHYLAPDPNTQTYSRVKVLNAKDDKALCFYVDYGDEALVDVSALKKLPSKYVTRLPFQAIQCRLYGLSPAFGEWEAEATDVLYNYMFEPDSDIFRSLYVEARVVDEGDLLRAPKKYSVLLKDGYGTRNVMINQLMIDCGYATTMFSEIEDFELPMKEVVDSGSEEEEVAEEVEDEEFEEVNAFNGTFAETDFDFELNDPAEFMKMLGINPHWLKPRQPSLPAPPEAPPAPLTAIPEEKPSHLTPEVYWSQTNDAVKLRIQLVGVEKYKVSLLQNRIFTFSTALDENKYELKFILYQRAELGDHGAYGQEVRIALKKIEAAEWLQLSSSKKRLRNIHYEILDSQLVEPRKKRILELDITDDESDGDDDDDGPMYNEVSDMDSEYDVEMPPSSDED